ncbi:alpha/beta fold hydrolase [Phytohabitans rumicis]|nr:alpha/beta hydrolase [Phytohabitans rumicis]
MNDVVVTDDNCRLWAQQTGQGPPVLLCHGGPGLWDIFGDLAQMLAGTARVIRWDQRGCGRSEHRGPYTVSQSIADLDAVRQHLAGPQTVLLGHSWGATLALRYALRHPDRVSKLIYVSGTGIDPVPTWNPVYKQKLRDRLGKHLHRWDELDGRARTPAEDREMAVLQWTADFADDRRALELAKRIATPWFDINVDCNAKLNAEAKQYLAENDVAAQCRTLDIPTLVIHGAEDIRPPWAVDSLHHALPRCQRRTIAHAGHLPWVEDADTFRTTVSEFLALNGWRARRGR